MATGGDLRREGDLGWSFDMFGDSPVRVGRLTYPEVGERESEIVFRRRIEEGFALGTPVSQAEWERWVRGGEGAGGTEQPEGRIGVPQGAGMPQTPGRPLRGGGVTFSEEGDVDGGGNRVLGSSGPAVAPPRRAGADSDSGVRVGSFTARVGSRGEEESSIGERVGRLESIIENNGRMMERVVDHLGIGEGRAAVSIERGGRSASQTQSSGPVSPTPEVGVMAREQGVVRGHGVLGGGSGARTPGVGVGSQTPGTPVMMSTPLDAQGGESVQRPGSRRGGTRRSSRGDRSSEGEDRASSSAASSDDHSRGRASSASDSGVSQGSRSGGDRSARRRSGRSRLGRVVEDSSGDEPSERPTRRVGWVLEGRGGENKENEGNGGGRPRRGGRRQWGDDETLPQLRPFAPSSYDGKNVVWLDYKIQFEIAARINGWSKRQMADRLAVSLQGLARRVLSDMTPAQRGDYDYLVGVLEKKFDPPEREVSQRMQFEQRVRHPGETYAEFADELRRLCRKGHRKLDSAARTELVVGRFTETLEPGMMKHIVMRHPETLEDAVSWAEEYYAVEKRAAASSAGAQGAFQVGTGGGGGGRGGGWGQAGRPKGSNPDAPGRASAGGPGTFGWAAEGEDEGPPGIPRTDEDNTRRCYECGSKDHFRFNCPTRIPSGTERGSGGPGGQGPHTGYECWECHQMGHIGRNCPSRASRGGGIPPDLVCWGCGGRGHLQSRCPGVGRPGPPPGASMGPTAGPRVARPSPGGGGSGGPQGRARNVSEEACFHLGGGSLYIGGVISTVPVEFLLDTGCSVTLVDWGVWGRMVPRPEIDASYQATLLCAKGEPLKVHGLCEVVLEIGGELVRGDAVVADIPGSEVLLGMDLLEDLECSIHLTTKELRSHRLGISVPLYKERRERCARVKVAETICVPPGFEMLLPGKVSGRWESGGPAGVVEGLGSFHRDTGLMVAKSVVRVDGGVVPLRVANMGPETVVLRAGMPVALASPVAHVGEPIDLEVPGGKEGSPAPVELPEHLEQMVKGAAERLTAEELDDLRRMLLHYRDVFVEPGGPLGRTDRVKHAVDTGDSPPIRQKCRRPPWGNRDIISDEIEKMLRDGVIIPSESPWSSPIVLARKADGSVRFCVDYRRVNQVTRKDAYPLPNISDCLDSLGGSKWFCTLDLASGYWQVEMDEDSREKTAFSSHQGLFEFVVMPFGLANAPATFERLMELVLHGLQWVRCLIYLDDIMVYGGSFTECLQGLGLVLSRLQEAALRLKPKKCALFLKQLPFLGHVVSEEGISTDPKKVEAVAGWKVPQTIREVRSFLGFASYYRRFIPGFSVMAAPLIELTEKGAEFRWNRQRQEAFEDIRQKLISAPVLAYPLREGLFVLDTDASGTGIGAALSQIQEGVERPIAYASKTLNRAQRAYCTTRRECLAVVEFVKHFRQYLYGRRFRVRTDHASLKWLTNFKDAEGMYARWISLLETYDFEIEHRPGEKHANADALSRLRAGHSCPRDDCQQCSPGRAGAVVTRRQRAQLQADSEVGPRREGDGPREPEGASGAGRLPAGLDETVPLEGDPLSGDVGDGGEYCFCGEPWRGGYMVGCDECGEWFHGECVNLSEEEESHYSQEGVSYSCPGCAAERQVNGEAGGSPGGVPTEMEGNRDAEGSLLGTQGEEMEVVSVGAHPEGSGLGETSVGGLGTAPKEVKREEMTPMEVKKEEMTPMEVKKEEMTPMEVKKEEKPSKIESWEGGRRPAWEEGEMWPLDEGSGLKWEGPIEDGEDWPDVLDEKLPVEGMAEPDISVLTAEWLETWKLQDLRRWQVEDRSLALVVKWREELADRPEPEVLAGEGRTVKGLVQQWDQLEVVHGVLYRKFRPAAMPSKVVWQLVAPACLRRQIFKGLHGTRVGGHLGRDRTLEHVRQHFYWMGMSQDIKHWCAWCETCARTKAGKLPRRNRLEQRPVGMPLERMALDIMGPLPRTEEGNQYILVVADYFTKWVEAFAIPDQTAMTVADVLVREVICRYGTPYQLHSDQGSDFESRLFQQVCALLEIDKTRTTPYMPRSDGMVERFNRTVQKMLAGYVNDHKTDWDDHLPYMTMAYRATPHESTGCTPNLLMFGREVTAPVQIMAGLPRASGDVVCTAKYALKLREHLGEAYHYARDRLKRAAERQKSVYDRRAHDRSFRRGDWVWYFYTPKNKKFGRPHTGPFLVVQQLSPVTYRIQATSDGKTKVVHIDYLKQFQAEEKPEGWLDKEGEGVPVVKKPGPERPRVKIGEIIDREGREAERGAGRRGPRPPRRGGAVDLAPGGADG